MIKKEIEKHLEEAMNNAHTICIPIEKLSMNKLIYLVKQAKKSKVEVRLWHETSNFHQGVLVEVQRFHNRTDCTPFKNSIK